MLSFVSVWGELDGCSLLRYRYAPSLPPVGRGLVPVQTSHFATRSILCFVFVVGWSPETVVSVLAGEGVIIGRRPSPVRALSANIDRFVGHTQLLGGGLIAFPFLRVPHER